MKCLRCNSELKQYELNINFGVVGAEHQPHVFSPKTQTPHNPHSVFVCDNCGYVELSTKYCEESNI